LTLVALYVILKTRLHFLHPYPQVATTSISYLSMLCQDIYLFILLDINAELCYNGTGALNIC